MQYTSGKWLKAQQKQKLQCGQTDHKSLYMTDTAHKPMCFATRVGVVKGDHSTALFSGSNTPLGRRSDRSALDGSQPRPCLQPDIHPHYTVYRSSLIAYIQRTGFRFHHTSVFLTTTGIRMNSMSHVT